MTLIVSDFDLEMTFPFVDANWGYERSIYIEGDK